MVTHLNLSQSRFARVWDSVNCFYVCCVLLVIWGFEFVS
jgi:hypothetical protein